MPYRLPPYRIEATFTPLALADIIDWGLAALNVPACWKRANWLAFAIRPPLSGQGCN